MELGKIIQKYGWKRTGYVVTIKIYWSMKSEERGLSRKHIIESVKASLLRLQLSYVDIVIIYKADPMCPMEGESHLSQYHCVTHFMQMKCGCRNNVIPIAFISLWWRAITKVEILITANCITIHSQRLFVPWLIAFKKAGLCTGERADGLNLR